jgi:uncharacterized protein (DUF849 family)
MTADLSNFAKERVIIMSAPNGARRSQADHPALPVTAFELADSAETLRDAGVSILHLHVRDEQGHHTLDADRYREAIAAIGDRVGSDLIIQVTTEAVGRYQPAEQIQVVRELRPEAVSLALREILPPGSDEDNAARFFSWMRHEEIWPQFILYSVVDVWQFDDLRKRGVLAYDAPFALFVLGNYVRGTPGEVGDLEALLAATDASQYPWAVCCFGPNEHAVMLAAEQAGGHVRIGFENNVCLKDGSRAPDNTALIREFTAAIAGQARQPATAADIRRRWLSDLDQSLQ